MTVKNSKRCHRSLLAAFNEIPAPDVDEMDVGKLPSPASGVTCHMEDVVAEQLPSLSHKSSSPPVSPGGACAIVDVESGKSPGSLMEADERWLTGSEIDSVQTMLRQVWSGNGLQSVTSSFTEAMPRPFVQVLFSPIRQHWLTVHGVGKCVTVYDPMHGLPSTGTQSVIRCIAGKSVRVKYSKTCTRQPKVGDCGPYALAYAATAVLGDDPASFEFVPATVRPHLASMLRQNEVKPFPFVQHCICDGAAGGRMVACDTCDKWFHMQCLTTRPRGNATWHCPSCK